MAAMSGRSAVGSASLAAWNRRRAVAASSAGSKASGVTSWPSGETGAPIALHSVGAAALTQAACSESP